MDQFWRLVLIGRSEVMTEVVHHMAGEETQRQHGLDGVEDAGKAGGSLQEGVLGEKFSIRHRFGVGRHSGGSGQSVGRA